jgi:16S rRNA (cytosine967-C5)-methyltransferase
MDAGVLNILRTALYQIFFMDRVPDYAAVDEAVRIAKKKFPGRDRLINAVLRKSSLNRANIQYPDMDKDPALFVSVYHSHPLWLVEKLLAIRGLEETIAFCEANNAIPPLTLRVNRLKADRGQVIEALSAQGVAVHPTGFSPDGINAVPGEVRIRGTPLFEQGALHIQDEASQLDSILAAPAQGSNVLDLCAGAGGKTTHLAEIMGNCGRIMAIDLNPGKLKSLESLARRGGIEIIQSRPADASVDLRREFHGAFDLVLVDAPCSGTGTLRRNPEIKWRLSPDQIAGLCALQKKILGTAPAYIGEGGRIFYSTCSILPEENEKVIADFTSRFPGFSVKRPSSHGQLFDDRGFFRTSPDRYGMDGFFGALLSK